MPRNNPMQGKLPMHLSPRCGAKTRKGSPCQAGAMRNGRCRMHGGKSTGAPKGNSNALKHGRYTAQAVEWRRRLAALRHSIVDLIERASFIAFLALTMCLVPGMPTSA